MDKNNEYFLVDSEVLPEVFGKVVAVKRLLLSGKYKSINEAALLEGLSRSAYYKYKDHIFPFYEMSREKVLTLFFVVENFSGILSRIIGCIADAHANIITINQNIPINGLADITISIETNEMEIDMEKMMNAISEIEGVRKQEILARE
ncbi:MAG: ACT domain-containing protein [Bacillota bacterium]